MRLSAPVFPRDVSLVEVLGTLHECLSQTDVDQAVRHGLGLHPEADRPPRWLLNRFRRRLGAEQESVYCPGWTWFRALRHDATGLQSWPLLRQAAENYVEQTRYLFPILTHFAHNLLAMRPPGGIHLFLRDALAFWPPLLARDASEGIHFLAYSRCHQAAGLPPRRIRWTAARTYATDATVSFAGAMLVDVGIWGSLVLQLLEDGYWEPDTAVLFLGTRNPFIEGWANARLIPRLFDGAGLDPLDVVRLVDTVESLLKPFGFTRQTRPNEIRVELADPIALTCAIAFLWSLHAYARDPACTSACRLEWFDHFRKGREDPRAWCVREVVPKSQVGNKFLKEWSYGPLPPRNAYCGFSL